VTAFPKYERYKDCGVEWLGDVPEHWEVSKTRWVWKEVEDPSEKGDEQLLSISQYTGVTPTKADSRSESLVGYRRCKPDDLAINIMLAWQGGLGVSDYDGIVSPAYSVFRLRSDNNAHFLGYLYRTKRYLDEFGRNSTGIVPSRWRLYPDKFGHVLTLLPPIPEQDRIVAFLDRKTAEIDTLIAKKKRQIELLDEQKAILINRAVTRGLNPNAKLKPSGVEWIGEIPEHWEVLRAKHRAVYFTSGSRGWGEFYADEGELFLQSGDLTNDCSISLENAKRVKLPRKTDGRRTRLQTHDTVVCITGANTGRAANVGDVTETIYVNQHLCLVRPSTDIDHRYLLLALSGGSARTHFSLCQYGLKEGLNLDDVENCPFPVPPLEEQAAILVHLDEVSSLIQSSKGSISKQIQSLQTLRSTLIAHAVTGRIKV